MGNVFKPCATAPPETNFPQHDLHQQIPQLLSIPPNEFKRIYKQSKKSKYTKKLQSKTQSNYTNLDSTNMISNTILTILPAHKLSNDFNLSMKALINTISLLSLAIVKDIIFQIQLIPENTHRHPNQYNTMYNRQLRQRYVLLEELIMTHHGCLTDLHHTIDVLFHIGYKRSNHKYLVLLYEDLSFLDEIKFHISLKEKLTLSPHDYEQYKLLESKRYILYEKLSKTTPTQKRIINNILPNRRTHVFDNVHLLIHGYLLHISNNEYIYLIQDIIGLCVKFYLIPNDTAYSNLLSFSPLSRTVNGLQLDVYNFNKAYNYSLNIQGLNSAGTHYMYLVRNIALPKWIKDDITDLGQPRSIYDDNYYRVMHSKHLCCIYDQITYESWNLNHRNKQAMIVFDPNAPALGGYNIEFAKSFALNLYLWNRGDRKIYHRRRNSLVCLNRIGNKSTLSEYDIDGNKYNALNGILKTDRCEGAGMCLFDNETKLLLNGGHSNKRKTLKSSEIYCLCDSDVSNEYNAFGYVPISDMNLARMNQGTLYTKELSKIVIGGGQNKDEILDTRNPREISDYFNKYRYLTPHTIEIFDLHKNEWSLCECKTRNGYASNPYLWYSNSNPFVINIFNSYLSYAGQRANHSEFIDLRECKQWYQRTAINHYLKHNQTEHILMF